MEEMKEIIEKLNKAADTYYNNGEEIISNYEYDMLFDKLVDFENKTGIILSDSPTQKVGSNVLQSSKLKKVTHKHPALSLDKTKSIDDLKSWLGDKLGVLSWKMDGLTGVASVHNLSYILTLNLHVPKWKRLEKACLIISHLVMDLIQAM